MKNFDENMEPEKFWFRIFDKFLEIYFQNRITLLITNIWEILYQRQKISEQKFIKNIVRNYEDYKKYFWKNLGENFENILWTILK